MGKQNDTLRDLGRRELVFSDNKITQVLPEFFKTEYPKLITLLEQYYNFEDDDNAPSRLADDLFYSRDITQTDLDLLSYIEDELLLGQSYFEGFTDKRAAAKYSNTLYRSKGTKYSIQQFFRTFFGVDPDIIYTKENVFKVGETDSQIGLESQKFLTDNKLFQTFAIQVKSDISFNEWREPYKLFVHPAGMFIGSEVQIVSSVTDELTAPLVVPSEAPPIVVEATGLFGDTGVTDLTSIVDDLNTDSAGVFSRINAELTNMEGFDLQTIQTINNQYSSLREAQIASSPTFDDSDEVGTNGMDLSNNLFFETLDQDKHQHFSADSDQYLKSFTL
jgi:hypothetical protein